MSGLTKKDIPRSYEQASKLLVLYNAQRRISSNGWLYAREDESGPSITLKLHNTNIVRFIPNGEVELTCGGYHTVTTQSWMNAVLKGSRYYVSRRNGVLHVLDHPTSYKQPRIELPCTLNLSVR